MITSSHLPSAGRPPNRRACAQACRDGLASSGMTTAEPAQVREAVAAMDGTAVLPTRAEANACARLILLHDTDGAEAWDGTMRLVAYIQPDLDSSEAVDPLLPEVAWSWLGEAPASARANGHAA